MAVKIVMNSSVLSLKSSINRKIYTISRINLSNSYQTRCSTWINLPNYRFKSPRICCSSSHYNNNCNTNKKSNININNVGESVSELKNGIGSSTMIPSTFVKLSLSDQAFLILSFIACTTCIALASLVVAAIPALYAMGRAAISFSKLADTARGELPTTMAAIRLSGMEISDLTLELNDLSQEIADGVSKSAQVVQAAEAGVKHIGSLARQQTMSMIQERANLPVISLQPVVAGAANKTSRAVDHARKTFMGIISRGEYGSDSKEDKPVDRLDT